MKIDDIIGEILSHHMDEIRQCIVDYILEQTIDVVLETIYSDINRQKIKMEGVLNKQNIYDNVIGHMKIKGKNHGRK